MRLIDLTSNLQKPKGGRVVFFTMYLNHPYYGFADHSKMSTGIGFVRSTKKGLKRHRSGTVRYYFGSSPVLRRAVSKIRKRYGLKCPVDGWEKVRVKAYNLTDTQQIIELISVNL